jgi:hypothetical protein
MEAAGVEPVRGSWTIEGLSGSHRGVSRRLQILPECPGVYVVQAHGGTGHPHSPSLSRLLTAHQPRSDAPPGGPSWCPHSDPAGRGTPPQADRPDPHRSSRWWPRLGSRWHRSGCRRPPARARPTDAPPPARSDRPTARADIGGAALRRSPPCRHRSAEVPTGGPRTPRPPEPRSGRGCSAEAR